MVTDWSLFSLTTTNDWYCRAAMISFVSCVIAFSKTDNGCYCRAAMISFVSCVTAFSKTENGCYCRAAMIGFVLAVVAFSKTGKNIYQQIGSWPQPVFAVFALIAVGTLVPILRYA